MSRPLIPWWILLPLAITIAALVVTLAGCAPAPYWTRMENCTPLTPGGIVVVANPGGRSDLDGFTNRATLMIELRAGLPPERRACVIGHELRHFQCWQHPVRIEFATDCGDGTIHS